MKNALVILAALAAVASSPALAADAETGAFISAQTADQYLAKDHLIGAKVIGKDGKIVGDVEDLIVNDSNQIIGAVMGTGGVLGFAEKKVAVPLSVLKFEEKDGKMTVSLPDATNESLAAAPEFKRMKPAKSLFERAQEKVHELSDKTTATTKDAYDKAKPTLDEAKHKAQEALEKAKEAAAPALEKAKEAVGDAIDEAKKAADDAAQAVKPAPSEPAAPSDAPTAKE